MIKTTKDVLVEQFVNLQNIGKNIILQFKSIFMHHSTTDKRVFFRKFKIILATFLTVLVFLFIRTYFNIEYSNIFAWSLLYAGLGVFTLITTYFLLRPFSWHSFLVVGVYPAMFAFLSALSIHSIFLFQLARLSYVFVFIFLVVWYFFSLLGIFLMTNILNVNMFNKIPLGKLAEGVLRIMILLMHVMVGFLIYIILKQTDFFEFSTIFLVIMLLAIIMYLWASVYQYFTRDFSVVSISLAFVTLLLFVITSVYLYVFIPNFVFIMLFLILFLLVFIEIFVEDLSVFE